MVARTDGSLCPRSALLPVGRHADDMSRRPSKHNHGSDRESHKLSRPLLIASSAIGPTADVRQPGPALTLERVVILMRHGIRPPTNAQPLPPEYTNAWPRWPVEPGLLTPHGAACAARRDGSPLANDTRALGGALSRGGRGGRQGQQQATHAAHRASLTRRCATRLYCTDRSPCQSTTDPIFHGLDDQPADFDGARALTKARALMPKGGGMAAETAAYRPEMALLARLSDAPRPPARCSRRRTHWPGCRTIAPSWTVRSMSPRPRARISCSNTSNACR